MATGSKYDAFWMSRLVDLQRTAAAAAADGSGQLGVADLLELGDRQSWSGNATVQGRTVLRSHMAHVDSLAKLLAAAAVFSEWPQTEFSISINSSLMLSIRRRGTTSLARPPEGTAKPRTSGALISTLRLAPHADVACAELHRILGALPVFKEPNEVPFANGLYFFYERGETSAHATDGRVVRVGNHPRAADRLIARLGDHYATRRGAKNGSVFRRYIGGALLRRDNPTSQCLSPGAGQGHWEHQDGSECSACERYEYDVSRYLTNHMQFRCIPVENLRERNELEKRLIATIAQCKICRSSPDWLGLACYAPAVQATGMWNAQHVEGSILDAADLTALRIAARPGSNDRSQGLSDSLLIVPCSASKSGVAVAEPPNHPASEFLGEHARSLLKEGRRLAFMRAGTTLDEQSQLRPALAWYTGQPYVTPGFRDQLIAALSRGMHCLIISGGYGILLPGELIYRYEAHMPTQTRSVWKRRLPDILTDYIGRNGIRRVFLSISHSYADCLPESLGVDEWRHIPTFDPAHDRGAAMRVIPERIGAATTKLLARDLQPDSSWKKVDVS